MKPKMWTVQHQPGGYEAWRDEDRIPKPRWGPFLACGSIVFLACALVSGGGMAWLLGRTNSASAAPLATLAVLAELTPEASAEAAESTAEATIEATAEITPESTPEASAEATMPPDEPLTSPTATPPFSVSFGAGVPAQAATYTAYPTYTPYPTPREVIVREDRIVERVVTREVVIQVPVEIVVTQEVFIEVPYYIVVTATPYWFSTNTPTATVFWPTSEFTPEFTPEATP